MYMLKKISLAAALLCCAAISPAVYADGIGSAIGDAASGIANAGTDIIDGAENAERDILNGFTADDTTPAGPGSDSVGRTTDSKSSGSSGNNMNGNSSGAAGTAGRSSGGTSEKSAVDSSEKLSSGIISSTVAGSNPDTGISMGYVASAAVLAAMGVVVTAIRRRDD